MFARQTVSYLRKRLREVGLQPDKRHGQNFLIDLNLIDILTDAAELQPHDVIFEVGTGMATLTGKLVPHVAHVVTVEIDASLAAIADEELAAFDNYTLLQQDALRNKNNIDDTVRQTLDAKLAEVPGGVFKFVGNLPYNVATPLISNLLHWPRMPERMVVTIQKELADRICAQPGTKDYGALSIWIQSLASVEIVKDLPPSVFWPPPKVNSAIIRIIPDPAKKAQLVDVPFFHKFVRALFFHRRKFLRSVLNSAFKQELPKADVDEVLASSPFEPDMRAEQMTVSEIQQLCELFRLRLAEDK